MAETSNVERYKIARRKRININGRWFTLRDLSAFEIDEAVSLAMVQFGNKEELTERESLHFQLEVKVQTISKSILDDLSPDDIRENFIIAHVNQIFAAWFILHDEAQPDPKQLRLDVTRLILMDDSMKAEAFRIRSTPQPSDYFGIPANQITDAQLCYYSVVSDVYDDINDGKGTKLYSKKYLEGRIKN